MFVVYMYVYSIGLKRVLNLLPGYLTLITRRVPVTVNLVSD